MKKTMFITSVIMVVVMAIALTTSSLAWFTAAGSATVTTNALQVSAKSTASAGLQISINSSDGPWGGSADLAATGNASMIPADLVLNGNVAGYTSATYSSDPYAVATALDALVGEKFINNDVDSNGLFSGTAQTANDTSTPKILYYTDTVWISSVDTQNAKNVQASIAWYGPDGDDEGTDPDAYTYHTSDPILYVAVLAAKEDSVKPDRDTAAAYRDWEILAIFNSGNQTTVRLGADADHYATGATVAARGATPTIASLECANKTTTVPLGAITRNSADELQAYGSSREFKIIAWYDGQSLINANSNFNIYFELTFTAVAVL